MRRCGVTRVATLSIYCFIAILLIFGFSAPVAAQTGSIRLQGMVWDPSGEVLPGAALEAVEESTGRTAQAVSGADGRYVFPALPPGVYTITAKAQSFKDVVHRGLSLFTPGTATENFTFEVAGIDKEVPAVADTRMRDSQTASSFPHRELELLPLQDRNPLLVVTSQPGVQVDPGNPDASTVNGTRPAMNTVSLDGVSITDPENPRMGSSIVPVNPDIISDVQIVTVGAGAEYGRSGGGQFTLTSRPGAKSWSGSIYDYFRNRNLDANEYFNNAAGVSRPAFTRNIFGATLSGPAFGKKTIFFANFEGNQTEQEITRNRQVLTPEAKSGIFRWYAPGTNLKDGEEDTIQSFDIVANDPRGLGIDPQVAQILARLPNPNNKNIGDGLNTAGFKFNSPADLNRQAVNVRLDHYLSSRHQLFLRANWNRLDAIDTLNDADAPFPGEEPGKLQTNGWGFTAGSDMAVNPRLVNELRIGYFTTKTELERPARLQAAMLAANSWMDPLDTSFPRSFKAPYFEISDYVSHQRSNHGLKFGFTFRRTTQNSTDYSGTYPTVTLGTEQGNRTSLGPSGVSVISSADRQTFENLYNDLLGRVESVNQVAYSDLANVLPLGSARQRDYSFLEYAAFIQDDWRILPNLTLNLGLRYELNGTPKEQNGLQAVLDQASQLSNSANIANFKVVAADRWYDQDTHNFAPRAGFAWDPFGSGTLVLRGSYGIYYDRLIGGIANFIDANSYGFSQNISLFPNSQGGDVRLSDGIVLPGQPSAPVLQPDMTRSTSIAVLDPDLRTPRVDQFHLTLEKRLFGAILEASYVGTRGKRLFQHVNLNQTKTDGEFLQSFKELRGYRENGTPVPASNPLIRIFGSPLGVFNALGGNVFDSGQTGLAADILDRNYHDQYAAAGVSDFFIRNFPQFDALLYGSTSSKSWYDALQLGVRKSTADMSVRVYYTWSKALDTISSDGTSFVTPSDSRQPLIDKAFSDFDRTHVFNGALTYALPYWRTRSDDSDTPKWIRMVLGGWSVGALWVWESGQRFSVNSGIQNRYAGVASLANFEGTKDIGHLFNLLGTIYWFDQDQAKQFTYPDAGEISTSSRNFFRGPRYFNLDLLLQKNFLIGDKRSMQFRIEAYNPMNSVRYSIPDTNLFSPNFGIITSTQGNPRRLQLALRYQF